MWISSSTLPAWVSWCLCCTAQAGCPPMPLANSGSPAALGSTWQNTFSLCYPFLSKYLPGSPRGRAELWVLLRKTFLEGSSHPIPVTMHDKYLCQTLLTASSVCAVRFKRTCFISITSLWYLWVPSLPAFRFRVPHDCHCNYTLLLDWINFFSFYDDHDWDQGSVFKWQLHACPCACRGGLEPYLREQWVPVALQTPALASA